MKTIKNFTFALVTLVTFSLSFTSCDALSEALSKEVEMEAPAIDFSIGGAAVTAPQQKVSAAEVVWLDRSIDVKTRINEELTKNKLKLDNVKKLELISSVIKLSSSINKDYNLGNIKLYINGNLIATGIGSITSIASNIILQYNTPYSILNLLEEGNMQVKITSDQPKPDIKLDMKLVNTYLGNFSLI